MHNTDNNQADVTDCSGLVECERGNIYTGSPEQFRGLRSKGKYRPMANPDEYCKRSIPLSKERINKLHLRQQCWFCTTNISIDQGISERLPVQKKNEFPLGKKDTGPWT